MRLLIMRSMVLVVLIFVVGLIGFSSSFQEFGFILRDGGPNYDIPWDVTTDPDGNIIVTGSINGPATFGRISLAHSGVIDAFLAKYTPDGAFLWAISMGGTGWDVGRGVATDDAGNIYVIGYFENAVNFATTPIPSRGESDIFVARYSPNGLLQWVKTFGGAGDDTGWEIAIDSQNRPLITGYFTSNAAAFGNVNLGSEGGNDVFLAQLDPTLGSVNWAISAGGPSLDLGWDVAIDSSDNIYVVGEFANNSSYGRQQLQSLGRTDIVLSKYDPSGSLIWVESFGGNFEDYGTGLFIDAQDRIYMTGNFTRSASFGSQNIDAVGFFDIFAARLNTDGAVEWVNSIGVSDTSIDNARFDIAADAFGNSYVVGDYFGQANKDGSFASSLGEDDIIVAKFDEAGNFLQLKSMGGTGSDGATAATISPLNSLVAVGHFRRSAFGVECGVLQSAGGSDVFVAKLDSQLFALFCIR